MGQRKKSGAVEPDDPWCWLIAAGNCALSVTVSGFFCCFGVFYKPLMAEFSVQYGDVSLMSGLFAGAMAFGALVPAIAKRYSCRKIGMFLGFIFSLSLLAASQSPRMELIHVLVGSIGGVSGGALTYNMYLTCNRYFSKHRAKGTSISMLGVPLGFTLLPPLLDYLIEQYTWRGAMALASAMALHSCVAASLYRPLILRSETPIIRDKCEQDVSLSSGEDGTVTQKRSGALQRWSKALDCALFTEPNFVLMLISAMAYYSGLMGAIFILVPFGIEQLELTSLQASFLLTLTGVGDCLGKIVCGTVGDFERVDRAFLLSVTTFIAGVCCVTITTCSTYHAAAAISFVQGFMTSAYHGQNAVLYTEIVGLDRLAVALGYHGLLNNIVSFPVIYLLGLSIDRTKDLRVPFYISAGLMICASLSLFGVFLLKRKERRQDCDVTLA